MGRDDRWSTMATSVVPSLRYSLSGKSTWKHPKWQNRTSDCESDSELESPDCHLSCLVTIRLSRLVSKIFA